MRLTTALFAMALTTLSAAARADAQMFAPEEFGKVTDAAVAQFKADMPQHASMFYGLELTRTVQDGQEIGVLAKIFTKMGSGAPSVMSKYDCVRTDAGDVQCHPAS